MAVHLEEKLILNKTNGNTEELLNAVQYNVSYQGRNQMWPCQSAFKMALAQQASHMTWHVSHFTRLMPLATCTGKSKEHWKSQLMSVCLYNLLRLCPRSISSSASPYSGWLSGSWWTIWRSRLSVELRGGFWQRSKLWSWNKEDFFINKQICL